MAIAGLDTASAALGLLTARHAGGSLIVGGIDLLLGLASQSIMSFGYDDNTSDQASNLMIQIADPARTWMSTYLPKKGVECSAQIKVQNWSVTGDTRMIDCGVFWLDQIDFFGPPNVVQVQAISIPVITGIKTEKKWRGWEGVDMQKISQQIADEYGLSLVWKTPQMPKLERVDEVGSPDLEFLRDKLKESSLNFKIHKKQLVVYSEEELEAQPAVYVLTYGMSNIVAYSFSSKLDDTYKEAEVTYTSPKTGEVLKEGFSAPTPPEGANAIDKSTERIEDDYITIGDSEPPGLREFSAPINTTSSGSEDAKKKAKAKLRDKNKKEKLCEMALVGNPDYISGLNLQLLGFGIFDGKWHIYTASHEISSAGYTTTLMMRSCLDGY